MSAVIRSVWFALVVACCLALTPGCLGVGDNDSSGGGGERDTGFDAARDASTPDAGTCTESQMTATGWIRTSIGDFDASTVTVYASADHKVEADIEDGGGCLTQLEVSLRMGTEGCDFWLRFAEVYDYASETFTRHGALVDVVFVADSFCPGVSDEVEGDYWFDRYSLYSGIWFSGLATLPDHDSLQSCAANIRLEFPDEWFVLGESDPSELAPVSINLSELILEGDLFSEGLVDWECLQTTGGCASGHAENEAGMCTFN